MINALEMQWTFIVEGAPFASLADWKLEEYERDGITRPYVHYVICAYDVTLEIISNTEPVIRKVE